jgi:hypothetical protein
MFEGNKKDLGTRLKPSLTGWSLRVTVLACDLNLLHSCPSALADCLSSHGAWILYETRFSLSSDLATCFGAISLLFLRLLSSLFTSPMFLGAW